MPAPSGRHAAPSHAATEPGVLPEVCVNVNNPPAMSSPLNSPRVRKLPAIPLPSSAQVVPFQATTPPDAAPVLVLSPATRVSPYTLRAATALMLPAPSA